MEIVYNDRNTEPHVTHASIHDSLEGWLSTESVILSYEVLGCNAADGRSIAIHLSRELVNQGLNFSIAQTFLPVVFGVALIMYR